MFVSSYDESIRIYDARKFREIGLLEGHSSTILQMKNFKNMLYSSSDEGKILVWKNAIKHQNHTQAKKLRGG